MKSPAPLDTHTIVRVERLFPFAERLNAQDILLGWSDQRFCDIPSEAQRVRFSALKFSEGDLERLKEAIELANADYRDLLVEAGFAQHPEAHQRWWPENKSQTTRLEIGKFHWLGEPYTSSDWNRFTLFQIARNDLGGSTSWPIAEFNILSHPSRDGCHPHTEIKIHVRNDVRRVGQIIEVDKNRKSLRRVVDIVEPAVIESAVQALLDARIVTLPFSIYACVTHVESFRVEGDFWNYD